MSRRDRHVGPKRPRRLRIQLKKASGLLEPVSSEKLTRSLIRCGTPEERAANIARNVLESAYDEMPTEEIRKRVLQKLKDASPVSATLYNLSRAVMQLGPTGFPFEKLVGKLYETEGYRVEINQTRPGRCVDHEIDVVAHLEGKTTFVECKFHNVPGFFVDLKTSLYIKARSDDLANSRHAQSKHATFSLITNTRFSSEALKFGTCSGIDLVGWTHPENGTGLTRRLERSGLIPLTALTSLPKRLAAQLMVQGTVTVRDLVDDSRAWRDLAKNPRILRALQSEIDALLEMVGS